MGVSVTDEIVETRIRVKGKSHDNFTAMTIYLSTLRKMFLYRSIHTVSIQSHPSVLKAELP